MKYKFPVLIFICLLAFPTFAKKKSIQDNPEDMELLQQAVEYHDYQFYDKAGDIFEELYKKYPNDHLVNYERAMNMYARGKYAEVEEICKWLVKQKESTGLDYQMYGNCVDLQGRRIDALKVYVEGLEKHPDAGMLYLEVGNLFLGYDDDTALKYYNRGINHDPSFASNYYRAAQLYFESDKAEWGLIYAETQIMLNLSNEERRRDMGLAMQKCYAEKVTVSDNGNRDVSVKLAPGLEVKPVPQSGVESDQLGDTLYVLTVPGVLESCTGAALGGMVLRGVTYDASKFESLVELRRNVVRAYCEKTDNYFGDALYLLEYQKKVIDAGHWEAYNYFLFSDAMEYECEKWNIAHPGAFEAFVEWYNGESGVNQFSLDDGRTVGADGSLRCARPMDMIQISEFVMQLQMPLDATLRQSDDAPAGE